jgi:hypothetical protein
MLLIFYYIMFDWRHIITPFILFVLSVTYEYVTVGEPSWTPWSVHWGYWTKTLLYRVTEVKSDDIPGFPWSYGVRCLTFIILIALVFSYRHSPCAWKNLSNMKRLLLSSLTLSNFKRFMHYFLVFLFTLDSFTMTEMLYSQAFLNL